VALHRIGTFRPVGIRWTLAWLVRRCRYGRPRTTDDDARARGRRILAKWLTENVSPRLFHRSRKSSRRETPPGFDLFGVQNPRSQKSSRFARTGARYATLCCKHLEPAPFGTIRLDKLLGEFKVRAHIPGLHRGCVHAWQPAAWRG
jgi:hypothetical protein